jgi:hypothetical protein
MLKNKRTRKKFSAEAPPSSYKFLEEGLQKGQFLIGLEKE